MLKYIFLACLYFSSLEAWLTEKMLYTLNQSPIDVVIPCAEKDVETLDLCIKGLKENVTGIRRIIVISSRPLTDKAEWFDEKNYPFTHFDIALELLGDEKEALLLTNGPSRIGWIFQQFLKLYAPFTIPDISSNVLIVDADTIFLNPVQFLGPSGEGFYNPSADFYRPYFVHMGKLLPGLKKVYRCSGICHHMLFQKAVLDDLFHLIENYHSTCVWKAMCQCIDPKLVNDSSMSEYEIYFNFVFHRSDQMKIQQLMWCNLSDLSKIPLYKNIGYHYVSCHAYLREH